MAGWRGVMAAAWLVANPAFAQDGDPPADDAWVPEFACPDGQYHACAAAYILAALRPALALSTEGDSVCAYAFGGTCQVIQRGVVNGDAGPLVVWQATALAPSDGPATQMVALFEHGADGAQRAIGFGQTGAWFDGAAAIDRGEDGVWIHVPGIQAGTAGWNADLLAVPGPDGYRMVDATGWIAGAERALPEGFALAHGASLNLREMVATARVSRAGDGHCCPSGGTIIADLALGDDALSLAGLRFTESRGSVRPRDLLPTD